MNICGVLLQVDAFFISQALPGEDVPKRGDPLPASPKHWQWPYVWDLENRLSKEITISNDNVGSKAHHKPQDGL